MSASTTTNYNLYITDDANEKFQDWRRGVCGTTNSNMTKIDAALAGKADKSRSVYLTLTAAGWTGTGPFTQVLTVTGLGADQAGNICVSHSATAEEREVVRNALLGIIGQAAGTLTIVADGDKPAIDIPVTVTIQD